jgi:hypothetical protein
LSPIVGLLQLDIHIPSANSLKDKRRFFKRFRDGMRAHYNVSVSEVGDSDLWRRLHLSVAMVANEESFIRETLDKCITMVAREPEVEILCQQIDLL